MGVSGDEPTGDTQDAIIDINEPISRSDFLKKVVAGGVISAVAITGIGGVQKVFGDKDSGKHIESGDNSDIANLIQKVNQLSKQLGDLQGQFADVISGKMNVPEMAVIKLTVPDNGFLKINGESTFHKMSIPEDGFLKMEGQSAFTGDSAFHKLSVPENGFLKIEGDSAFLKMTIPENGFLKMNGDATFLKLDVPDTGFLKIEGQSAFTGDAAFLKLDATDIVAQKIVTGSITTGSPNTTVG
ncbi:MAG TPA: hypothetical protein VEU72_06710 [Nitrosopumilaceae archaeon]|nr:hypothetical protein [Nitrosopumilaceae archaeon]